MNMSMDKNVEPKTSNSDQPYDESFFDFITKSSRFREQGIRDILGIDGVYVDLSSLLVPEESFQAHDLVRPLKIGRKFDLVVLT